MKLYPSLSESHCRHLPLIMEALDKYVDGYHIDIMDGHFVPGISWGSALVNAISTYTQKPLWLHYMVSRPEHLIDLYLNKKHTTYLVSIHQETITDWLCLKKYKNQYGISLGLAINPETGVNQVIPYIKDIAHILIMSVQPGCSGQSFLTNIWNKIEQAQELCSKYNPKCIVAVDGGVTIDHIVQLKGKKVEMIAAFSAIFGSGVIEKSDQKSMIQDNFAVKQYIEQCIQKIKKIRAV